MRTAVYIVIVMLLTAASSRAGTNASYLVIYPERWQSAVTNHIAFKTRLGFNVYTSSLESITGSDTQHYALVREYLANFRTNTCAGEGIAYAMFVGNFNVIPAPEFRVLSADSSSRSDIYHSDLHSEFNRDGDSLFGEYEEGADSNDFESSTFATQFGGLSNDLVVGRIPAQATWNASAVEGVLDSIMAFERETGARKKQSIMSAGRIDTNSFTSDSWDFVLKRIVQTVESNYPDREITTVVHCASNHVDHTGMDYLVEGDNISADYTRGQDIIRSLWETNDACSFLCNVSHGGSFYDFSIRRNDAGFPTNVHSAIIISMSCASFNLGTAALTNGIAATYLGSVFNVTPDIFTTPEMVSGLVQREATLDLFCEGKTVGRTFSDGLDTYRDGIQQPGAALFWNSQKEDALRNVLGFQLIGDPTLVHAYADSDQDGLLDPEEDYIGTVSTNSDTDADGLPDGYEFETPTVDPLVHNGLDCDFDYVLNADEILAGTDPLSDSEFPQIDLELSVNSETVLSWNSATGRSYCVEYTHSLVVPDWTNWAEWITGTGAAQELVHTNSPGSNGCYRLLIRR